MTYQEQIQAIHEACDERTRGINARFHCECESPIPTRRILENGTVTVWLQCPECGRGIRSVKKADYCVDSLPSFDDRGYAERTAQRREEIRRVLEVRDEAINRIWQERERQERRDRSNWFDKYNIYLRSQQWHALRTKVLARDGGICQACLTRKATQVHHLTYALYEQLGQSAAFECVAICHTCHEKIHPHMATAQHDLTIYSPYLNGASNGNR